MLKVSASIKTEVNLVGRIKQLIVDYANKIVNAPTSYKKVFGTKIPTVWEVKKTFTSQLKELAELAVMVGDKEALAICQMQVNADENAVKETEAEISKLNIPS